MNLPSRLGVIVAAALAAACGAGSHDSTDPDDAGAATAPARCVGPLPANASVCPGAEAGLVVDTARVVVGPAGACATEKCAYTCLPGATFSAGTCVPEERVEEEGSFLDNGDGTVTDALTGLVWLEAPACAETIGDVTPADGAAPWFDAEAWIALLSSGRCGLADGSAPGDWRLPESRELTRLAMHLASAAEAPFSAPPQSYWSSERPCLGEVVAISIPGGTPEQIKETEVRGVWPVR